MVRDPDFDPEELVSALRKGLFPDDPAGLLAVYLFGSQVRQEGRPDSDLDLAFLGNRSPDSVATFELAQDLASVIGCDVDLVDLTRSSTVMRAQVIGTGKRIFTHDTTAVDSFEMYALSDYARLQEERRGAVTAFVDRYRD
jgi:predicted nucleotidyltransferase